MKYQYKMSESKWEGELTKWGVNGPWTLRKLWCQEHCVGTWRYVGMGQFHFADEQDYLLFLLRWT